jgi:hypothetical protein
MVFIHGQYIIVAHTGWVTGLVQISGESIRTRIIYIEPGLCPYPYGSGPVLANRSYTVITYASRISRIMFIYSKIISIVPVEPGPGAKPHISLLVF